jgi:Bacterial regulatory helix-turn-helix protein, lysR family
MHRRHQHLNIPIEIVRTVVAISEIGSLSKAGDRLGLSQPAISSQIKRLQGLMGGALFLKTANGTTTTELGKLALLQARRILEANDQLLRLGGNTGGTQPLRLGLSTLFVQRFRRGSPRSKPASASPRCPRAWSRPPSSGQGNTTCLNFRRSKRCFARASGSKRIRLPRC